VGEEHSLGVASGSRGVHDARQLIGSGRGVLNRVVDAELLKLLQSDQSQVRVGFLQSNDIGGLGVTVVDDALESGASAGHILHGVEEISVGVGGGDLGLVHRVEKALFTEGVVDGDNDGGLSECTMSHQEPVGTIKRKMEGLVCFSFCGVFISR